MINHQAELKDFLFELGTEELPAKALKGAMQTLEQNLCAELAKKGALRFQEMFVYVTPRRLAIYFKAFGGDTVQGKSPQDVLLELIKKALKSLPMGKNMRFGNDDFEFSRPVKWVVVMHGADVIKTELFGLQASHITYGHRFHAPQEIYLESASKYLSTLKSAKVIADFNERRNEINQKIKAASQSVGHSIIDEDLLDEVTNIVEWPVAMLAKFDDSFLSLPREAIISALQVHQKCFAVEDKKGHLQPYFVLVSNIEPVDHALVVQGNERVVRARLSDAAFFFEQDKKQSLASRIETLEKIVYQEKLGSIFDKLDRMYVLAQEIARQLKTEKNLLKDAVYLSKADLSTHLVSEFPELQGIAGYYYALHDKQDLKIAEAIREHYQPRYASDALPQSPLGIVIALSDRIDTLLSLFSVSLKPTGNKDPYACRRAALGIIKICIEHRLPLDLRVLMKNHDATAVSEVLDFIFDRLHRWYLEKYSDATDVVKAVLAISPSNVYDAFLRLEALTHFKTMPEALTLAAAHKRVNQLLKKQGHDLTQNTIDPALFVCFQEKTLAEKINTLDMQLLMALEKQDYVAGLKQLATLKESIDNFFESVMVMDKDEALRRNRLSLLAKLSVLFLMIADLGELQIG